MDAETRKYIKLLQAEKDQLEKDLASRLREFSQKTGLVIERVDVTATYDLFYFIQVEAKL